MSEIEDLREAPERLRRHPDAWSQEAFDQQKARADAAEAEVQRLTEGLRERDELLARILDHGAAGYAEHQARWSAWVSRSASPSDGGGAKCPDCGHDLHGYPGPRCRYCTPGEYWE